MRYLVDMRLTSPARPKTPEEGANFIQQVIFPTLALCEKLTSEGKIVAGGPVSGAVRLVLIVEAESALELDSTIEHLPLWPLAETEVTPMTTFDGRRQNLQSLLGQRAK
jgi:hypothetical protein